MIWEYTIVTDQCLPGNQGSSGGAITGDPAGSISKRQAVGIHSRVSVDCNTLAGEPPWADAENIYRNVASRIGFVQNDLGVNLQLSAP